MALAPGIGRRWQAVALLAVGAAGGGAAWAVASVPDSSGVIHGCVALMYGASGEVPVTTGANLRVIDTEAGQQCTTPNGEFNPGEKAIEWNVTGPPGVTGPKGPPGQSSGSTTVTFALEPPIVKSTAPPEGFAVVGTGSSAYRFDILTVGFARDAGSGTATGHRQHKPLLYVFTKTLDKASPKLFRAAANGTHYPKVVLRVRKAAGGKQTYLQYTFSHVGVSSVQDGSGGKGSGPVETVTLNFTKVEVVYN